MPDVNPHILKWARETAGLTPEEAVEKIDLNATKDIAAVDRLASLETGETKPTRPMLVKMAKQYRRPLLTFYMSDIPKKGDRGEDFRTLPEAVQSTQAGLIDALLRDIRARQALVRASLEAADEAEPLAFVGSMKRSQGVAAVVASIARVLSFDRTAFRQRGKKNLVHGFPYLRGLAEAVGIFVIMVDNLGSHHTTIDVDLFRGFALADEVAPFVAINVNDAPAAWSSTLVHELAHLWIGASGVSGGTAEKTIEKFCNDVASEFLLPNDELRDLSVGPTTRFSDAMQIIGDFAEAKRVSATMVAYKLHRAGAFDFDLYTELKNAYRAAFLKAKANRKERDAKKDGGPSYYVIRKHRVGGLLRFVERMMHEGHLTTVKAGKVLDVSPKNVHSLIEEARPPHVV